MNLKTLQIYVDRREREKNGKWKEIRLFILAPWYLLMEYLTIRNFWKFITDEIGDNEELVSMLDKNEFGIGKWKIYKKDVIIPDSDLDVYDLKKLENMYKHEYSESFVQLLKKSSFDIENYVSLDVNAYLDKINDVTYKLIEVTLHYYRYPAYVKAIRYFKHWIICLTSVIALLSCILIFVKF